MSGPKLLTIPYQWDQRQTVLFGGLPVPVFGDVLPFVDLNDVTNWRSLGIKIDNGHVQNAASQFAWRAKGVWSSQDFVGRKIHIPAHYYEDGSGNPFSYAKSKLTQSGEQYLSFDGVTGIRVRCNSFAEFDPLDGFPVHPETSGSQASYAWGGTLEFLSRNPFAEDMVPQVKPSFTCAGDGVGVLNTLTYGGHAFASPLFTLLISGSGHLAQIGIQNVTSGEQMLINMPDPGYITGSNTIVMDSDNLSLVLNGSINIKPSGSFPQVYSNPAVPNAQTQNTMRLAASTIPGTGANSVTCNFQYSAKYEL